MGAERRLDHRPDRRPGHRPARSWICGSRSCGRPMADIRVADTAAIKALRATADRVACLATVARAARRVTVAPTERQATMLPALAAVAVTRVRRAVGTRLAVEVGIRPAAVGATPAEIKIKKKIKKK